MCAFYCDSVLRLKIISLKPKIVILFCVAITFGIQISDPINKSPDLRSYLAVEMEFLARS